MTEAFGVGFPAYLNVGVHSNSQKNPDTEETFLQQLQLLQPTGLTEKAEILQLFIKKVLCENHKHDG